MDKEAVKRKLSIISEKVKADVLLDIKTPLSIAEFFKLKTDLESHNINSICNIIYKDYV